MTDCFLPIKAKPKFANIITLVCCYQYSQISCNISKLVFLCNKSSHMRSLCNQTGWCRTVVVAGFEPTSMIDITLYLLSYTTLIIEVTTIHTSTLLGDVGNNNLSLRWQIWTKKNTASCKRKKYINVCKHISTQTLKAELLTVIFSKECCDQQSVLLDTVCDLTIDKK